MITELYLTADEQVQFNLYPAALRSGWQVIPEYGDSFENPRQLQMRALMSDFTAHPEIAVLAQKITTKSAEVTIEDIEHLSPEIQQEVYFIIGARGVDMIVKQLLTEEPNDDLLFALASMSTVRHKLLQLNSPTQS
jgi:hypothetical protein